MKRKKVLIDLLKSESNIITSEEKKIVKAFSKNVVKILKYFYAPYIDYEKQQELKSFAHNIYILPLEEYKKVYAFFLEQHDSLLETDVTKIPQSFFIKVNHLIIICDPTHFWNKNSIEQKATLVELYGSEQNAQDSIRVLYLLMLISENIIRVLQGGTISHTFSESGVKFYQEEVLNFMQIDGIYTQNDDINIRLYKDLLADQQLIQSTHKTFYGIKHDKKEEKALREKWNQLELKIQKSNYRIM